MLLVGVLSFFADLTYEGGRSIIGRILGQSEPQLRQLRWSLAFGELLGYALRLVPGRFADATGKFWPTAIFGYVISRW